MMSEGAITVRASVRYDTPKKAENAFLDAYMGDGAFDREISAALAGIDDELVAQWFSNPLFFKKIETRLQNNAKRRNSLQTTMLDEAQNILNGNMLDFFDQSESGNLVLKNINTLPRHITSAVKQMDIMRTSIPGRPAEFTECLRIVMQDKTKVMNLVADYTDVRDKLNKNVDSGSPKMVGLSLVTSLPTPKEQNDGNDTDTGGQVLDVTPAEANPSGAKS
jgi:uncharacterized UPF0160 family protein